MPNTNIAAVADATEIAKVLQSLPGACGIAFKRDDNTIGLLDPDTGTIVYLNSDYLNGITAGSAAANKAVIADASAGVAGLQIKLGNQTTTYGKPIAGITPDITVNASGTTQNTFYPLNTIALPANTLSSNARGIEFCFVGTTAANANAKDFRLTFGTHSFTLVTGSTANNQPFIVWGWIFRTAAGAQIVSAEISIGTATVGVVVSAGVEDETTALNITVDSQNTAAAAASATGKGATGWFQNV